jgi:hypothetical protein
LGHAAIRKLTEKEGNHDRGGLEVSTNASAATSMTDPTNYHWIALQVIRWWCMAALLAVGFVIVLALIGWTGRLGLSFPWYGVPFAAALGAVAWLIRRVAISSLRSLVR